MHYKKSIVFIWSEISREFCRDQQIDRSESQNLAKAACTSKRK